MKVIAVIKDTIHGTKYNVYKKVWFFWFDIFGYKPLNHATFLIKEHIDRLKLLFGEENVVVIDKRIHKKPL